MPSHAPVRIGARVPDLPRPSMELRTEGGAEIGHGHLARCLALAQAWMRSGGVASIRAEHVPDAWMRRLEAAGVLRAGDSPAHGPPDWIVLDGYSFTYDDQRSAREQARLLVIDDHGQAGRYEADVVADQNIGARPDTYASRSPDATLLLGPRYALLREEFDRWRRWERSVEGGDVRVLVFGGGSPPTALRSVLDDLVGRLRTRGVDAAPLEAPDVAAALATADIAVSAAGSICWELCALGTPAILVAAAENQRPLCARLAERGAASCAGWWEQVSAEDLEARVLSLAEDVVARQGMAQQARSVVDGWGSRRVVARLRAALLTVRPAERDDARMLWEWATDPVVRAASFDSRPIAWDDHVGWFERQLADPDALLLVAEVDGEPVGQIRFNTEGREAQIGVSVAAAHRGGGLGAAIVVVGIDHLFATSTVVTANARIKPDNHASRAAFTAADFDLAGDGHSGDAEWVHYARHRDDPG